MKSTSVRNSSTSSSIESWSPTNGRWSRPGSQGLRVPSAINGEFWYGNNSGFKNSLDKNYPADAEATGLVEVLPLHVVTDIVDAPDHRYTVKCRQIDESGATLREVEFNCRHLFLAAGSVGTTKMPVKAREKGTLKKLNRHVGEIWGNNGDFFGMQVGLPDTNPDRGGPAASAIEHHDNPFGPTVLLQFPQWDETRRAPCSRSAWASPRRRARSATTRRPTRSNSPGRARTPRSRASTWPPRTPTTCSTRPTPKGSTSPRRPSSRAAPPPTLWAGRSSGTPATRAATSKGTRTSTSWTARSSRARLL